MRMLVLTPVTEVRYHIIRHPLLLIRKTRVHANNPDGGKMLAHCSASI